ncbi:MAG: prepilin-type N-terminal cleavage/methylation domain-containing protein [Deltaproteobacteria bacterium]|nr:prepilin-type N-terminal cleavage/methylation domain-containing protein [Deltaproteobacteria bacterium]
MWLYDRWKVKGRRLKGAAQPSGKRLGFASGSKGFTLVELLVVLVLIGIFSSLVFVSVAGGILRSEENRFIQSFTQTLIRARSASLGRGEAVRFFIDGESRTFCVEGLKRQNIPESIKVEGEGVGEVEPGVHAVTFYPDGSSSGGEIDLKWEGGRLDRIVIDKFLGLIRMERISS